MAFTSGEIVEVESQSGGLGDFNETTPDDADLESYVSIDNEYLIGDGITVKNGIAAREKYITTEGVVVDNNEINIGQREDTTWQWTEFWFIPNQYLILSNGDGKFASDLIERTINGSLEPVRFDLEAIVTDYRGQWMGSIEDRQDNVESAVMYGEDIENDGDMGSSFLSSDKNQIGPWINYDSTDLKVRVGKSWFQVLKPGDYTRNQFLELYLDVLSNYLR